MKCHVILNPAAGQKNPAACMSALQRLGAIKLWTTTKVGDGEAMARHAVEHGAEVVVAAGGDATIGEVINGLAGHLDRVRLGILPLGTGNDFARGLHIPLDPMRAAAILRGGPTRAIDLVGIRREGAMIRHFANVAVSGFPEEAKKRIEQGFKAGWGPLGYLLAAAEAIPEITSYQITLHYSDDGVEGLEASILVVANGGSFGGGIPIVPPARLDDGLLDVIAFRPVTSTGLLLIAPALLRGTHLELEQQVYHRQARCVTVQANPLLPFHVDDHYFTLPQLTFEVLPRALRVIAPEGTFVASPDYGIEVGH